MNLDGFLSSTLAAFASLVRGCDGTVLALSHTCSFAQPIHLLELRGALLGLELASSLQLHNTNCGWNQILN